jgi:hypothetical protein
MIRYSVKLSAKKNLGFYKLRQHKPLFDKECSRTIRSKEASKMSMVTGSTQVNGDNLNNVRHEASKHVRNKMQKHMKEKISDLKTVTTRILEDIRAPPASDPPHHCNPPPRTVVIVITVIIAIQIQILL